MSEDSGSGCADIGRPETAGQLGVLLRHWPGRSVLGEMVQRRSRILPIHPWAHGTDSILHGTVV